MARPAFTPEEELQVCRDYETGMTGTAIAELRGVSYPAVYRVLAKHCCKTRTPTECLTVVFTPEETASMIAAYAGGEQATGIARRMGRGVNTILKNLKKHGVRIRSKRENSTALPVNEAFFSAIDTEEKAYWLGFIGADGCVYKNNLGIALAAKDVGHLEKFKACIQSGHPIKFENKSREYKGTVSISRMATIRFASRKVADDLLRCGITPNKSLTLQPWQGPPELMRHYWRGMVDGDGCLQFDPDKQRWSVGLVGTLAVVTAFRNFAKAIAGNEGSVSSPLSSKISVATFRGTNSAVAVMRLLYDGATIYLDRKKATANNAIAHYESRPPTIKEMAEQCGIKPGTLQYRLSRGMDKEAALSKSVPRINGPLYYQGKKVSINELARQHGIGKETLRHRLWKGMGIEEALSAPVGPPRRKANS